MSSRMLDATQRRAAVVAGCMFFYIIAGSITYMDLVRPRFITPGDAPATASSIAASALLFRVGVTHELLMAACVVVLAWGLYVLLKPVDKNLALLALCWRLAESVLWIGAALTSHLVLDVVSHEGAQGAFEPRELNALVAVLMRANTTGMNVVVLFTGLGTVVFSWLLLKSRYVPRFLAVWGILTYVSMILFSCAKLISPRLASWDMIVYTPGGIFEIVIGFWLVAIGVKTKTMGTATEG